jgi:galacturan 1,4-alpha-galacturonidase
LTLTLEHSTLSVHGFLTFTADTDYWIKNVYPLDFQNQSLAFIITGHDFVLDGNDKGGIDGNGQVWYSLAKDFGNYAKR